MEFLLKFDWLLKVQHGIWAHTPGLLDFMPSYGGDDGISSNEPAGEYSIWTIIALIPNFGTAFVNMTTDWAPVFTFLFYLASSAIAIDFDSPSY